MSIVDSIRIGRNPDVRRLGRFKVTEELLAADSDEIRMLLANVEILEQRKNFCFAGVIDFLAESSAFDEVKRGDRIPEYTAEFKHRFDEGGNRVSLTYEWKRRPW